MQKSVTIHFVESRVMVSRFHRRPLEEDTVELIFAILIQYIKSTIEREVHEDMMKLDA